MESIYIRDLAVDCVIGTEDRERRRRQRVMLNIELECDLSVACSTDNLADTVDYKTLKNGITALVEGSSFFLIEKLAGEVAAFCLSNDGVLAARVCLEKPGALTGARSVAVEITRRAAPLPGVEH